jgi:hypothetical protein
MRWWRKRLAGKRSEAAPSEPVWNEDTREVQALVDYSRSIEARTGWATAETGLLRTLRDGLRALE